VKLSANTSGTNQIDAYPFSITEAVTTATAKSEKPLGNSDRRNLKLVVGEIAVD
jgi:hypothetical protein